MPSEAEQCVAAFFHLSRALAKRKPVPGAETIRRAMIQRADDQAREASEARKANWLAERSLAERGWD